MYLYHIFLHRIFRAVENLPEMFDWNLSSPNFFFRKKKSKPTNIWNPTELKRHVWDLGGWSHPWKVVESGCRFGREFFAARAPEFASHFYCTFQKANLSAKYQSKLSRNVLSKRVRRRAHLKLQRGQNSQLGVSEHHWGIIANMTRTWLKQASYLCHTLNTFLHHPPNPQTLELIMLISGCDSTRIRPERSGRSRSISE